jgi:type II secretory pathway pseudopilin PulG
MSSNADLDAACEGPGLATPDRAGRPDAFTLLETVIVLAMLIALGALAAGWMVSWRTRQFDEGVGRLASTLRMLRADAARQGRRIRLEFDGQDPARALSVSWEPMPLEEPGQWQPMDSPLWSSELPNGLVRVVGCTLLGDGAWRSELRALYGPGQGAADGGELPSVMFLPDGTCDSCLIELAPLEEDDPRRAVVQLDGINARVTIHETFVERVEELIDRQRAPDDDEDSFADEQYGGTDDYDDGLPYQGSPLP